MCFDVQWACWISWWQSMCDPHYDYYYYCCAAAATPSTISQSPYHRHHSHDIDNYQPCPSPALPPHQVRCHAARLERDLRPLLEPRRPWAARSFVLGCLPALQHGEDRTCSCSCINTHPHYHCITTDVLIMTTPIPLSILRSLFPFHQQRQHTPTHRRSCHPPSPLRCPPLSLCICRSFA